MSEQINTSTLIFGSIILGQYNGIWYKVRCTVRNRAGVQVEWLEGPIMGKENYHSNYTIKDTNQFRIWTQENQ